MESIAELRNICQTTAKKDVSNVYMRYVSRFFSIYLTRLILPLPVTPNQVSFAMIVTGVFATFFFLSSSRLMFLAGAFLLQLWYIIDCMDGEVARYRLYQKSKTVVTDKRQSGMSGKYYDVINHYIINLLVPAMIGVGLFELTGSRSYILLGIFGSLGQVLTLAMHDGGHRITIDKLMKYRTVRISGEICADPEGPMSRSQGKRSIAHWIFMIVHYTMTYPTVMNLVAVAAILEFLLPGGHWRILFLWYLTLGSAVVTATIITRIISRNILDEDFKQNFQVLDPANDKTA